MLQSQSKCICIALPIFGSNNPSRRAVVIEKWINDMGYKAAIHNWSFTHQDDVKSGSNVYGVLHAPRGDTTESMILCAPWINGDNEFNEGGVALAIALARYFTRWSVWSKDIIIVIPSDTRFGLSKWVADYHYTSMSASSGAIQGGVVLDFPGSYEHFSRIEVKYTGYNGQLPNLDLINTAVLISAHMHLNIVIHGVAGTDHEYKNRATTLLRGIIDQSSSGLYKQGYGNEPFSGWRVDAITLKAVMDTQSMPFTQIEYGKLVESVLRSINNLQEHFHQSFFFYLMISPWQFVSIGTYLPAAMLVGASFTIKGIYLWLKATESASGKSIVESAHAFGFFVAILLACAALFTVAGSAPSSVSWSVFSRNCRVILIVTILQVLLPIYGLISGISVILPFFLNKIVERKSESYITKLRSYSLIYAGLVLTTLSTLNFSLALILGLLFFPLAHLVKPSKEVSEVSIKTSVASLVSNAAIILTSPWTGILLYFRFIVCPPSSKETVFPRLITSISVPKLDDFVNGMMWNWRALGVWSFVPILFLVWLPLWISAFVATLIQESKVIEVESVKNGKAGEEKVAVNSEGVEDGKKSDESAKD